MGQSGSFEQLLENLLRVVNRLKKDTESSIEHVKQNLSQVLHKQQGIEKCIDILYEKTNRLEAGRSGHEEPLAQDDIHPTTSVAPQESHSTEYELLLAHMFQTVFANDTPIQQAARTCLDKLFTAHPPSPEHIKSLQKLEQQLGDMADTLAEILDITKQLDGPTDRLAEVCQRIARVRQESKDYQRCYQDKYFELSMPISLNPDTSHGLLDSVMSTLRIAMRKMLDPLGYFTEKLDRLVTSDLVTVIDICDDLKAAGQCTTSIQKLLLQAGLEDTSPQVGEPFNAHDQTLIGFREGAARDTILSVNRRGLHYKERSIRKASVVIGR